MQKEAKQPLISVIIPAYNVEKAINRCIGSIAAQKYRNLDIIIIDDGSTDGTADICDKLKKQDSRIRVFHTKNSGVSDARNLGVEQSKGKFVSFVDGDDYVDPDYILSLYAAITQDKSDIAIGGHKILYPNKQYEKKSNSRLVLTAKEAVREVLYDQFLDLSPWGKLYDKRLFKGIRYPSGMFFEDSAITPLLLAKTKSISVIPEAHYSYVKQEQASITNDRFNPKKLDLIVATKQMTEKIIAKYPDLKDACARRLMWAHLSTLSVMAKSKYVPKDTIKDVYGYIKANRSAVLKDPNISKRDRFGLFISKFGYRNYKIIWSIYDRLRK